jgi:phosphatidylinositol alpha-mannosyltransferase
MEHVDSVASHLERRGHEVYVLAPNDPLDFRTRLLHPKLGRHGPLPARVTPVGRSIPLPSNGSLANIAFSPTVYGAVRRAMHARQPDLLHVHEPLLPLASWAAMEVAQEMGIPAVGTFHANYPNGCAHYGLFKPVLAPYFEKLSARIAVSQTAAATIAASFPGEYRIIPNGVDVGRFRPTGAPRDPNRLLFVGRPVARKGLAVLFKALPALLRRVPAARLAIVGSAPEDVRMPKGLLSSVEIRGAVDGEALVSCMHSSSVLCAPSTGGESFGVVLVEAMAAGLPIVASGIPGYEAVVTSGKEGVLVPPGDATALAGALVGLLLHPARRARLSAAGRASAQRYDWSLIAAELEEVYLEVTGRSRSQPPPMASQRKSDNRVRYSGWA